MQVSSKIFMTEGLRWLVRNIHTNVMFVVTAILKMNLKKEILTDIMIFLCSHKKKLQKCVTFLMEM